MSVSLLQCPYYWQPHWKLWVSLHSMKRDGTEWFSKCGLWNQCLATLWHQRWVTRYDLRRAIYPLTKFCPLCMIGLLWVNSRTELMVHGTKKKKLSVLSGHCTKHNRSKHTNSSHYLGPHSRLPVRWGLELTPWSPKCLLSSDFTFPLPLDKGHRRTVAGPQTSRQTENSSSEWNCTGKVAQSHQQRDPTVNCLIPKLAAHQDYLRGSKNSEDWAPPWDFCTCCMQEGVGE